MRGMEYNFVPTDSAEIVAELTAKYEELTERTLMPADPDKLFISWVAGVIVQERIMLNYAANQNIPSRAEGENLDALGEMIYNVKRPQAKPALCTMRFEISAPQNTAVEIPKGVRVTDSAGKLAWATVTDAAVPPGELFADVSAECAAVGTVGNGFAPGQINTLVDIDKVLYYRSCRNIDTTNSGMEQATDEEYYGLMRQGLEAYSTAGPKGAYEYYAKAVSTGIADVCAINPASKPGHVAIYAIMTDGSIADDGTKKAILDACNDEKVRPLTDMVETEDPEVVDFDIELIYYVDRAENRSLSDINNAVKNAVNDYVKWQCGRIGRDINPSQLVWRLNGTGIKRADIIKPVYSALRDGSSRTTPQTARLGTVNITNGGFEDE